MQTLQNLPHIKDQLQQRLEAILSMLQVIRARQQALILQGDSQLLRSVTVNALLDQLEQFSRTHYRFFMEGFSEASAEKKIFFVADPEGSTPTVPPLSAYYVFGTILDQIANDLIVIQRASEQRIMSVQSVNTRQQPVIAETLTIADRLAFAALQRILHLVDDNSTVLTYFQKSPNVRVIPYAPVALIGIPATCYDFQYGAGVGRDLLAIAHELGHHLYWNGQQKSAATNHYVRAQVRTELFRSTQPKWLQNWLEEIFADVVSCWIGGPVAALSMQDLQMQARGDWMLMDNGIHPFPALRPYIYSETLRLLGMGKSAGELELRWDNKLIDQEVFTQQNVSSGQTLKHCLSFFPLHPPNDPSTEVPNPLQIILDADVIRQILAILNGANLNNSALQMAMWVGQAAIAHDLNDELQVNELYQSFEQWVINTFSTEDTAVVLDTNPALPGKTWVDHMDSRGVEFDIVGLPSEKVPFADNRLSEWSTLVSSLRTWEAGGEVPDPILLSPRIWLRILEFAGWSTEGPTDGNISGQ